MTEVLVDRRIDQPHSDAEIQQLLDDTADCRAIHRLDRHRSLLSADRQHLICHLTSPDLESVRVALRSKAAVNADIWSCTLRDAPGLSNDDLAQANVWASWRFELPVALDELESIDPSGSMCMRTHRVHFLRAYISTDRRRVSCLCQAADAESVRLALRDSKWPAPRVWAFSQF
jgi:hypothetical protein